MRSLLRIMFSSLMLIGIGLGVVGGFALIRYLEKQQFQGEGGKQMYVEMDEITIPIIRNNTPIEMRTYRLTLETRDGAPLRIVLQSRPRLTDLYISAMSALATRAGPEDLNNVEYLRAMLVRLTNDLLVPGAVRDIYIHNLMVRPIES